MEGWDEVSSAPEAEASKNWAEKIRPLLIDVNQVDQMTKAQARDHLLARLNLPEPESNW